MGYSPKRSMLGYNIGIAMMIMCCMVLVMLLVSGTMSIRKRMPKTEICTITIQEVTPSTFFNREVIITKDGDILKNDSGYDGVMKAGNAYEVEITDGFISKINRVLTK